MRPASRTTVLLSCLLLLAGCGVVRDDGGAGPVEPSAIARDVDAGSTASLEAALAAEKLRIAATGEAEGAVYDSLKVIWDAANDDEFAGFDGRLICDPLQYAATVKIVGPEGADLDFGPHKLSIPAGALSVVTVVAAEAPTALQPLARFSPHGTVFNNGYHPRLDLSYKHCRNVPGQTHRLGYLGENGTIVEWPPAEDHPEWGIVRGWIAHFSAYIVAF